MTRHPLSLALLLIGLLPLQASCSKSSAPASQSAVSAAPAGPPQRIVSMAPNLTEIVFHLGAGERVVGVTRFCDFPPEVGAIPKIGGFTDPSFDAIVSLRPDLVLSPGGESAQGFIERLRAQKLRVEIIEMPDLASTFDGIEAVGRAIGAPEEGQKARRALEQGFDAMKPRSAARPKVLFVVGRKPLVVAGAGTFGHDLIERAGGVNAAGDSKVPYPTWSFEQLVRAAPEVIIDARMVPGDSDTAGDLEAWSGLPAVETGRVHSLKTGAAAVRPGPRLLAVAKELVGYLHSPGKP